MMVVPLSVFIRPTIFYVLRVARLSRIFFFPQHGENDSGTL